MWIARFQLLTKPEQHVRTLDFLSIIGLTVSFLGALPLSFIGSVWHPGSFIVGLISGLHILIGIAGGLAYTPIFGWIGARFKKTWIHYPFFNGFRNTFINFLCLE
jgi:hypothetical protein